MKSFTLIELLIGVAIFLFVLLGFGAFISSVTTTEFRALAVQKLVGNTRTALEIMGREMRLAQSAGCAASGSFEVGNPGPGEGSSIKFTDFDGQCLVYDLSANTIRKSINGSPPALFLGGGDIRVTKLVFKLLPSPPDPGKQNRILINADVETNDPTKLGGALNMSVQTAVSQRGIN